MGRKGNKPSLGMSEILTRQGRKAVVGGRGKGVQFISPDQIDTKQSFKRELPV